MADAGRSLKKFYVVLALIAVVGIVLIVRAAGGRAGAPLVMAECGGPPIGGVAPAGVAIGPDSAPVQITEYGDFECPECARFAILTMPDVLRRLIPTGKLRWQFMDFPLSQHANSPLAHVAAACAAAQGKFWAMEYSLYYHQDDWYAERNPEPKFIDYARAVGVNVDSFRVCVNQRRPWPQIEANRCAGDRLAIEGTPTFFVNGHRLAYTPAYDDLVHIVDSVTALPAAAAKRR
jgi:protein-disulfide isomerase